MVLNSKTTANINTPTPVAQGVVEHKSSPALLSALTDGSLATNSNTNTLVAPMLGECVHDNCSFITQSFFVYSDLSFVVTDVTNSCSGCGKGFVPGQEVQRCNGCSFILYCNYECQAAHLKKGHAKDCFGCENYHRACFLCSKPFLPEQIIEKCSPCAAFYCSIECRQEHWELCHENKLTTSLGGYFPPGLVNIGNTCYANSSLQCLYRVENIAQAFLSRDPSSILEEKLLQEPWNITQAYNELVVGLKPSHSPGAFNPTSLLDIVFHSGKSFTRGEQGDAHELMTYVLEALDSALNVKEKKPYVQLPDFGAADDLDKAADLAWEAEKSSNHSLVSDTLKGQLLSKVQCIQCSNPSYTFDVFQDVSVEIPPILVVTVFKVVQGCGGGSSECLPIRHAAMVGDSKSVDDVLLKLLPLVSKHDHCSVEQLCLATKSKSTNHL